jgi:5-formyltetrahydrofolate cyclo-ligase
LLAFDLQGVRLGTGKGYYDKTLKHTQNPVLVGVAYPFQQQLFIKADPWDVKLTAVVTPSKTYWCKNPIQDILEDF